MMNDNKIAHKKSYIKYVKLNGKAMIFVCISCGTWISYWTHMLKDLIKRLSCCHK